MKKQAASYVKIKGKMKTIFIQSCWSMKKETDT